MMKNARVKDRKSDRTGTVVGDVTYRRNAGRSFPQVKVLWDGQAEAWNVLVRNLVKL